MVRDEVSDEEIVLVNVDDEGEYPEASNLRP
jgi:hypothetical protein